MLAKLKLRRANGLEWAARALPVRRARLNLMARRRERHLRKQELREALDEPARLEHVCD